MKRAQQGSTLVSVLVAMLVFGFGLLALAHAQARLTAVASQNQNIARMAGWSHGLWAVLQANPAILPNIEGTWDLASYPSAPPALAAWLGPVVDARVSTDALPLASVAIHTDPGCSAATCAVTVHLTWRQHASPTARAPLDRSQSFSYQFF